MSISEFISISARAAPGLAAARARRCHQSAIASSAFGHMRCMSDRKPHSASVDAAYSMRSSSVAAHG